MALYGARSASAPKESEEETYVDICDHRADVIADSRTQVTICIVNSVENGCIACTSHVTR